ncbi:DNA helicase [Ranunculus cassubicifolius]
MINIPSDMIIPWENEASVDTLIEEIFPNLSYNARNREYIAERALLTPLNDCVDELNDRVLRSFPGDEVTYYSFDSVQDDPRNLYQPEFLNSLSAGGLPPHKFVLKLDAPVMLLRNINPAKGLCNGTRLLCRGFDRNMIYAEFVTGHAAGNIEFIPRIPMKSANDLNLPFQLLRKQFPIRLSFALTINKAQGQTIKNVGIFLPQPVFSHGQLYVALSRGIPRKTTKIMVKNGTVEGHPGVYTTNVVYKDVLHQ